MKLNGVFEISDCEVKSGKSGEGGKIYGKSKNENSIYGNYFSRASFGVTGLTF